MSTFVPRRSDGVPGAARASARVRAYLFSDPARTLQTVLALIWLLDGGLQFQADMYDGGFIAMVRQTAVGEPGWVHASITWAADLANRDITVWNTLFALTQVAIGIGLLVRSTVRPALVASFVWALVVWWIGNAFGGLLNATAAPLTGAPGAVLLYALVGLIAWPGRPGGLLGVRGARIAWAALWLLLAGLWLQATSAAPNAVHDLIAGAPSGLGWLTGLQHAIADATRGGGVPIALTLAATSAVIGVGVGINRLAAPLLGLAVGLNLAYWVIGQGFGGVFAGGATDPNAGPLFIVLAYALFSLIPCAPDAGAPTQETVSP